MHEALFTFHGFRYIRVTGMENAKKEDFTAVLLSSLKENAGFFSCSNEKLTRLYQNIRWSQYSNMMSIPTDCPTREKGGYTGDLLIYARTALKNEKLTPFFKSWLNSVRLDQADNGVVMIVAPFMKLYENMMKEVSVKNGEDTISGVAGWSDAIVWIPYEMYHTTGDELVNQSSSLSSLHSRSCANSCPIKRSFFPGCPVINAYAALRLAYLSKPSPGILFSMEHFR